MCMTDSHFPIEVSMKYLNELRSSLNSKYSEKDLRKAISYSIHYDFKPVIYNLQVSSIFTTEPLQ